MGILKEKTAKGLKDFFSNKKVQESLILFALLIFSLIIRRMGIKHGFPLLTHPDEAVVLNPVFNMTRNRTLNPEVFNRPNQILYLLNFIYLNLVSYLKFGVSLAGTFLENQVFFHYYARLLISLMGSFIPLVAYKIGKEFNPRFALAAGLVFAFFPLYSLHSLYITPDVPITLFTLLVMLFTLRYLNGKGETFIYLAVLFAAINTAEKYPGLISLSIVFTGVLIKCFDHPEQTFNKNIWRFVKKLFTLGLLFLIALFLVAPFLFIEIEQVIEAIRFETATSHLGADNLGWGGNLLFYIRTFGFWSNSLSVLWIGFGIYALVKWRNKQALLLLYGVLYWVILSYLSLHWERWALPMYITPLFLIAIGMTYFWHLTKSHPWAKLLSIIILLFLSQQLIATVHTSVRMVFTDTRLIASDFSEQNSITPENTIYEGYSPFLPSGAKNITRQEISENEAIKYIMLSSYMYDRYFNEPDRYKAKISFYETIRDQHLLIEKFEPTLIPRDIIGSIDNIIFYFKRNLGLVANTRFTGPTIEIYQIVN